MGLLDVLRDSPLRNLDLLSVGITIASIGILGFVIYISDKRSSTNRAFLYFALATILWSIFNYLNYQSDSAVTVLWLLRGLMFSATWVAFTIFQLLYVFPEHDKKYSRKYKF